MPNQTYTGCHFIVENNQQMTNAHIYTITTQLPATHTTHWVILRHS